MLQLTAAIAVPNIQRIRLRLPQFDDDNSVAYFAGEVQGPGGRVYATFPVEIRNGQCSGIRATVAPVGYTDYVQGFVTTVATGYTDVVAAYNGAAGGIAARLRAVETALSSAGVLPPGTVS